MNTIQLKAIQKLLIGKVNKICDYNIIFTDIFIVESSLFADLKVTSDKKSFLGSLLVTDSYIIIEESCEMLGFPLERTNFVVNTIKFNGQDISEESYELPKDKINEAMSEAIESIGDWKITTASDNVIKVECSYDIVDFEVILSDMAFYFYLVGHVTYVSINDQEITYLPENILKGICHSLTYANDKIDDIISDTIYQHIEPVFCLSNTDYFVKSTTEFKNILDYEFDSEDIKDNTEYGWKKTLDMYIKHSGLESS